MCVIDVCNISKSVVSIPLAPIVGILGAIICLIKALVHRIFSNLEAAKVTVKLAGEFGKLIVPIAGIFWFNLTSAPVIAEYKAFNNQRVMIAGVSSPLTD